MQYFTDEEQKCKCGCGLIIHNSIHELMMDQCRAVADIPFIVTSWTRCAQRNADEKGKENSDHLTGEGTDIFCETSQARWKIIRSAIAIGFTRIGIGKNFIHLGSREDNPQKVLWLY